MVNKKYTALYVLLALIPTIYLLTVFGTAPDEIPIHYTVDGVADAFGSKWRLTVLPIIVTGLAIGGLFAPFFTKHARENEDRSLNGTAKIYIIILLFLDAISINFIYDAIHYTEGKSSFLIYILYILNAVVLAGGFFMPRLKSNSPIPVRVPFVLVDNDNWDRTHGMGGRLFVIAGTAGLVLTFITNGSLWGGLLPLLIAFGLMFLYSALTFYKK